MTDNGPKSLLLALQRGSATACVSVKYLPPSLRNQPGG